MNDYTESIYFLIAGIIAIIITVIITIRLSKAKKLSNVVKLGLLMNVVFALIFIVYYSKEIIKLITG